MTCCNTIQKHDQRTHTVRPAIDVRESDDAFTINANIPGADAGSVEITVEDGVLTLEAARSGETADLIHAEFPAEARFQRRFRIGEGIDTEGITAELEAGVLAVTLPKADRARRRRVPIGQPSAN